MNAWINVNLTFTKSDLIIFILLVLCPGGLEAPQKSVAHQTGTTRSIFAPSFDLDTILPDNELPKLSHPSKDRPKVRKTHFAKRPVMMCESLLIDDADADEIARQIATHQLTLPTTYENDKRIR